MWGESCEVYQICRTKGDWWGGNQSCKLLIIEVYKKENYPSVDDRLWTKAYIVKANSIFLSILPFTINSSAQFSNSVSVCVKSM